MKPAADFGPKHFLTDNSSDDGCNDDCFRQIKILKHNRKGKKDIHSLSDKHIDSQIPLASNFDDDDEDDLEFEDIYNNNVTNEQQKRLNKQNSIDFRSDDVPLKNQHNFTTDKTELNLTSIDLNKKSSKKCMYSRQNMNFINDWSADDSGLHMKLNFHQTSNDQQIIPNEQLKTNQSISTTNNSSLTANQISKFDETNF